MPLRILRDSILPKVAFVAVFFCLLTVPEHLPAAELQSQHTVIEYDSDALLVEFNRNLSLGNLGYLLKGRPSVTVAQEVGNKVDIIVEKVQDILEMYNKDINFKIVPLPSAKEVQHTHRVLYGRRVLYVAFYSPADNTIYISIKDTSLPVLTHEIAHVVLAHYFKVSPSAKIHEVLAQFAEENIGK